MKDSQFEIITKLLSDILLQVTKIALKKTSK